MSSSPHELTKAGRYQIVRELGRGAMGVVYQGFDPVIGRTVAIKTMLLEGSSAADYEEYKQRFQREARAAGALSHPNIVTVHDFGEDNGVLYLAMEFLKGVSLEEVLRRQKVLPVDEVVRLFEQVSSALDHAHRRQVVHRDIKPANIMLLENGQAKVTDFGIARLLSSGTGMTRVGQIVGTPSYMSPEQVRGLPVDGRSDIFSLGVILYLALTGRKPFEGPSLTTVIYKIVNENPVPLSEIDKNLHPGLGAIVSRALAKDPNLRYQTCGEMVEELKKCGTREKAPPAEVAKPPVQVTKPAPPAPPAQVAKPAQPEAVAKTPLPQAPSAASAAPRRFSTMIVAAVVAVVVVVGVFGGYLLRRSPQNASRERTSPQSSVPAGKSGATSSSLGAGAGPSEGKSSAPAGAVTSGSASGASQTAPQTNLPPPAPIPPSESKGGQTGQSGQNPGVAAQSSARGPAHPAVDNKTSLSAPANEKVRANPNQAGQARDKTQTGAPAPSSLSPGTPAPQQASQPPSSPSPPPSQPDASATSQLIVETEPAGYDVFVDDKGYGRSDQPVVANITPGKHVLSLKKNGAEVYRKPFTQTTDTHEMTIRPQPH